MTFRLAFASISSALVLVVVNIYLFCLKIDYFLVLFLVVVNFLYLLFEKCVYLIQWSIRSDSIDSLTSF